MPYKHTKFQVKSGQGAGLVSKRKNRGKNRLEFGWNSVGIQLEFGWNSVGIPHQGAGLVDKKDFKIPKLSYMASALYGKCLVWPLPYMASASYGKCLVWQVP